MRVDLNHVQDVIDRANRCTSGMVEVPLGSPVFHAVDLATKAGYLEWVANGVARITTSGRTFLGQSIDQPI